MGILRNFAALATVVIAGCSFTCQAITIVPSSRYVTKKIKTPAISAIKTSSSIDIEYSQGPLKVEVYAPENAVQYVSVSVTNGVLTAKYNVNNITIKGKNNTKIKVSAPDVRSFSTTASGDIDILTDLNLSGELSMTTNASGDIEAKNVKASSVKLSTNASGDIEIDNIRASSVSAGSNASGDIKIEAVNGTGVKFFTSGSGDIAAYSVSCNDLVCSVNASGDMKISNIVSQSVKCISRGSGDMELRGKTNNATYSTNGSGDIQAERLTAKDVTATTNGSGDIRCYASESITATKRGSGTIGYAGKPANVVTNRNGIKKIN